MLTLPLSSLQLPPRTEGKPVIKKHSQSLGALNMSLALPIHSVAAQQAFYNEVVPWLGTSLGSCHLPGQIFTTSLSSADSQPWIERYAAFGAFINVPDGVGASFVKGGGSLTSLGNSYANA